MVEFDKVLYSPDSKMVLIFLYESLPKGYNVQMSNCLTLTSSLRSVVAQLKSPFGDSCFE